MKFFSKYKKQIFSVFLCAVLFSCFTGFSVSSSAAVENVVTPLTLHSAFFEFNHLYYPQFGYNSYFNGYGSAISYDTDLGIVDPSDVFNDLVFAYLPSYRIPEYSGRPLSLSLNIDFDVVETGYLSLIPPDVDISDSAIFTGCILRLVFSDGTSVDLYHDSFILKDDDMGVVVDPSSDSYWNSIKGNIMNLSIYALFDVSAYTDKTINYLYVIFPSSSGNIYYSNDDLNNYLVIDNVATTLDFAYTPFNDVVQDDLLDIKGSLSGVNNKLDSISGSMNTIDQDVNRVNQKLDQTNEALGDINQGIQDILKPSTPAVDFKNQWNDYFSDNPIPDLSTLPLYDMDDLMILLEDSNQIVRGIFSPFFLRDYRVIVPLTKVFGNVQLDPVASYVSLSIGLSIGLVLIHLLKGRRG